jgi:hypothetical protein
MNFLYNIARPPLILSFGRSGSMLLTHNIGHANNTNPTTVCADSADFLKTTTTASPIQSHQLHTFDDISKFTCIFNLRKNPVDTILSSILTNSFNLYHAWTNQNINLEPLIFRDYKKIDSVCQRYIRWCDHYTPMLVPANHVVYYEDYIKQLPSNPVYQPTYPEKKNLIVNYHQVLDYILKYEKSMLDAQALFGQGHLIQAFS